MISRRRLLQTGLSLAALPAWAGAANNATTNATSGAAGNAANGAANNAAALKAATGPDWVAWTGPTPPLVLPDLGGREQKLSA